MQSATVDLSDLIGKPFEYGARGPDKFDCYGLATEVWRRMGIALPEKHYPAQQGEIASVLMHSLYQFRRVETPRFGTLICFRLGRFVSHVGIWTAEDQMIHAWEHTGGVTRERLSIQGWTPRIAGYYEPQK